ncbi:hypothetical protein SNEBB_001615 [Seison nebaliae]|nr:hypothetical protein SNEBB_001615 [Seison nebaliae]
MFSNFHFKLVEQSLKDSKLIEELKRRGAIEHSGEEDDVCPLIYFCSEDNEKKQFLPNYITIKWIDDSIRFDRLLNISWRRYHCGLMGEDDEIVIRIDLDLSEKLTGDDMNRIKLICYLMRFPLIIPSSEMTDERAREIYHLTVERKKNFRLLILTENEMYLENELRHFSVDEKRMKKSFDETKYFVHVNWLEMVGKEKELFSLKSFEKIDMEIVQMNLMVLMTKRKLRMKIVEEESIDEIEIEKKLRLPSNQSLQDEKMQNNDLGIVETRKRKFNQNEKSNKLEEKERKREEVMEEDFYEVVPKNYMEQPIDFHTPMLSDNVANEELKYGDNEFLEKIHHREFIMGDVFHSPPRSNDHSSMNCNGTNEGLMEFYHNQNNSCQTTMSYEKIDEASTNEENSDTKHIEMVKEEFVSIEHTSAMPSVTSFDGKRTTVTRNINDKEKTLQLQEENEGKTSINQIPLIEKFVPNRSLDEDVKIGICEEKNFSKSEFSNKLVREPYFIQPAITPQPEQQPLQKNFQTIHQIVRTPNNLFIDNNNNIIHSPLASPTQYPQPPSHFFHYGHPQLQQPSLHPSHTFFPSPQLISTSFLHQSKIHNYLPINPYSTSIMHKRPHFIPNNIPLNSSHHSHPHPHAHAMRPPWMFHSYLPPNMMPHPIPTDRQQQQQKAMIEEHHKAMMELKMKLDAQKVEERNSIMTLEEMPKYMTDLDQFKHIYQAIDEEKTISSSTNKRTLINNFDSSYFDQYLPIKSPFIGSSPVHFFFKNCRFYIDSTNQSLSPNDYVNWIYERHDYNSLHLPIRKINLIQIIQKFRGELFDYRSICESQNKMTVNDYNRIIADQCNFYVTTNCHTSFYHQFCTSSKIRVVSPFWLLDLSVASEIIPRKPFHFPLASPSKNLLRGRTILLLMLTDHEIHSENVNDYLMMKQSVQFVKYLIETGKVIDERMRVKHQLVFQLKFIIENELAATLLLPEEFTTIHLINFDYCLMVTESISMYYRQTSFSFPLTNPKKRNSFNQLFAQLMNKDKYLYNLNWLHQIYLGNTNLIHQLPKKTKRTYIYQYSSFDNMMSRMKLDYNLDIIPSLFYRHHLRSWKKNDDIIDLHPSLATTTAALTTFHEEKLKNQKKKKLEKKKTDKIVPHDKNLTSLASVNSTPTSSSTPLSSPCSSSDVVFQMNEDKTRPKIDKQMKNTTNVTDQLQYFQEIYNKYRNLS